LKERDYFEIFSSKKIIDSDGYPFKNKYFEFIKDQKLFLIGGEDGGIKVWEEGITGGFRMKEELDGGHVFVYLKDQKLIALVESGYSITFSTLQDKKAPVNEN